MYEKTNYDLNQYHSGTPSLHGAAEMVPIDNTTEDLTREHNPPIKNPSCSSKMLIRTSKM